MTLACGVLTQCCRVVWASVRAHISLSLVDSLVTDILFCLAVTLVSVQVLQSVRRWNGVIAPCRTRFQRARCSSVMATDGVHTCCYVLAPALILLLVFFGYALLVIVTMSLVSLWSRRTVVHGHLRLYGADVASMLPMQCSVVCLCACRLWTATACVVSGLRVQSWIAVSMGAGG